MGWKKPFKISLASMWSRVAIITMPAIITLVIVRLAGEITSHGPANPSVDVGELGKKHGFGLYATFKEELPAEYEAFNSDLNAFSQNVGLNSEASEYGLGKMVAVRRSIAPRLRSADDEALSKMLRSQIDMLEMVASRETYLVCNQYLINGPSAISVRDRCYLTAIDAEGIALLRAVGSATRNPVNVGSATDDDWAAVADEFVKKGGQLEHVEKIGELRPDDEDLCKVSISFFKTVLAMEGDVGHRIRAELAYSNAAH